MKNEDEMKAELIAERFRQQQEFDASIREDYFAANPFASPTDFERMLPALRDVELIRRFERRRGSHSSYMDRRYGTVDEIDERIQQSRSRPGGLIVSGPAETDL